jgi:hypothetical protein
MLESLVMNRRLRESLHDVMTKQEVERLRHNLSLLSPSSVVDFYREAHKDCAVERKPSAKAIQQLVTAWKQLRRWRWK